MGKIQIKVSGMKCEHCKKAVEKALLALEGVESVIVDIHTGIADIGVAGDISMDEIKKAVRNAGYEIA